MSQCCKSVDSSVQYTCIWYTINIQHVEIHFPQRRFKILKKGHFLTLKKMRFRNLYMVNIYNATRYNVHCQHCYSYSIALKWHLRRGKCWHRLLSECKSNVDLKRGQKLEIDNWNETVQRYDVYMIFYSVHPYEKRIYCKMEI